MMDCNSPILLPKCSFFIHHGSSQSSSCWSMTNISQNKRRLLGNSRTFISEENDKAVFDMHPLGGWSF